MINEFIKIYRSNQKRNNKINILIKVNQKDKHNNIYFLNNQIYEDNNDNFRELNENNTELYIYNKKLNYNTFFKPYEG